MTLFSLNTTRTHTSYQNTVISLLPLIELSYYTIITHFMIEFLDPHTVKSDTIRYLHLQTINYQVKNGKNQTVILEESKIPKSLRNTIWQSWLGLLYNFQHFLASVARCSTIVQQPLPLSCPAIAPPTFLFEMRRTKTAEAKEKKNWG